MTVLWSSTKNIPNRLTDSTYFSIWTAQLHNAQQLQSWAIFMPSLRDGTRCWNSASFPEGRGSNTELRPWRLP